MHLPLFHPLSPGYHRGMDVIAETSFDVTSQACTFKWEGHGLKLHFQQDSLPANCPLCRVEIRASLSGQYALPADSELVSGVYWIYCPVKLSKHATLEIQHCSTQREGLSFVRAECTQNQLPYDFLRQKYGTFLEHFSYGSIELFRFSGYGISQQSDSLQSHGEQSDYIAQVFYHTTAVLNMWKVSFTIRCAGRGLELEETVSMDVYICDKIINFAVDPCYMYMYVPGVSQQTGGSHWTEDHRFWS